MRAAIDVCVPALVFAAMFVVGTDLTTDDFRRVARQPGIVLLATVGQFVVLPLIAWVLLAWLHPQLVVANGLLLVAACPSGAMANVYTFMARSNVALSVTLTAMSCLAALLATPLVLFLQTRAGESNRLQVPLNALAGQLIVLLIVPVVCGMFFRCGWPETAMRHRRTLLGMSVATLAALLVGILFKEWQQFVRALPEIGAAASLLTVFAFGAGWMIGVIGRATTTDRFALGMVFVVRNVGIATAIAVTVLGRSEFAVFATGYFLAQVPMLLAGVCVFRRTQPAGAETVAGAQGS